MALINCEECNHQFSDKAESCPKCGCPNEKLNEKVVEETLCPECKKIVKTTDLVCGNCSFPLREDNSNNGELMECPSCKKMVSRYADECPHCGGSTDPEGERKNAINTIIMIIGAPILVWIIMKYFF